jgi:hypothetical protein
MQNKLKIIEHQHSGKLKAHEHTSYIPLALLVLVACILTAIFSYSTFAEAGSPAVPGPTSDSVSLTGTVPTKPPNVAAKITSPRDGQHFSISPVNVAGTCSDGSLIEIYKNDIFAGSTPCDSGGKFSFDVDLLYGKNILVAKIYDVLNQAGPDSEPVTVFYDAQPPNTGAFSSLDLRGAQLVLSTDAVYRGKFPNQMLNVPISIIGGVSPYAVSVDWGDAGSNVIPRGNNTVFNASHAYKKPGIFKIILKGTDSDQRVAFLQVAAFINGQPSVIAASTTHKPSPNWLLLILPLLAVAVTLVASFWLGERREKRILGSTNPPSTPPLGATPQPQT